MTPIMVRYFDGLLDPFHQNGFSYDLTHHFEFGLDRSLDATADPWALTSPRADLPIKEE